jgi:hypothetical protein
MSADLDQLILDLASPDPTVRDDNAFVALATAATDGSLDTHDRRRLGDAMVQRLGHPAPYARSFAPLVLASLARGWDSADSAWPSAWTESIQTWWVGETDLRGYDPSVGWIHAMAHGADAIGALGRYGHAPSTELLKTVGERLVAPTEFVWRDQEDDRIAAAVIAVLQGDPDHANLTPMLTPIARLVPGSGQRDAELTQPLCRTRTSGDRSAYGTC